ncbi:helix-turn-helix transcriptional regulator [Lichenifustis flavocetrariae]|uniref:Helix-turn-helix transcriptional regulator n=1 Tax=Lichenifustis flavocetrariae TaxID=2949735 RepID=A0AA41YWJ3_9HYPH|nr:helix-turn-helix transcriptional regulator [Lichenifustis flavocetrariae]MCW6509429.1 helix-turn-helix transcriptional regulator [Lichenifustis flavocetrariae]
MTATVDRTQLQTIISGLAEGILLIETDQRITWANSAALAMHGVEDVAQIGATVSDYRKNFVLRYRNNHVLDDDRYPIDRVIAGDVLNDITVEVTPARNRRDSWIHRIRSLVLTDAQGKPDCLVLVITDATDRFAAEERFEKTFAANPAPAIICRLSDLRFVKVNQGFLDMTGYSREHILGRTTYEIDLFAEATGRALAIERLSEGRTIPQMEACIPLPGGDTRFVIVAGQPIEMGDEACMLFTFADLELRRKAESALKASEERFAKSFRLAPVPTVLVRLKDFRYLAINEAFTTSFGFADADVLENSVAELNMWADPKARERFLKDLSSFDHVRNFEACLTRKDGAELDCLISAERVTINDEECVLSVVLDITERKRTERHLMDAIEAVMADTSWFSRGVIERLASLRHPGRTVQEATVELSARERQVLGLMCQGLSDAVIGKRLCVSQNTVRNHVTALYRKLNLHRRTEVVVWARERGF